VIYRQQVSGVSYAFDGSQTNSDNFVPHMTPDRRAMTFTSTASNIVPGDTNGFRDIFASRIGGDWTAYCTAKLNSLGCTPVIAGAGNPSATNAAPFVVSASQVRNQKPGLILYTPGGVQSAQPFQGGTLCLGGAPIRRTPALAAVPVRARDGGCARHRRRRVPVERRAAC